MGEAACRKCFANRGINKTGVWAEVEVTTRVTGIWDDVWGETDRLPAAGLREWTVPGAGGGGDRR